ncbi:VHS domain-containing protein [Fistulina hepatica ATCC 64428]|uniref:VHS domain-containing protein n=1 Tax=Fistulina hepatica ATCC 64428 TaxID=1128425 RepID=A0A0D7AIT7_9AGAR|nr:VHS domain-containing protein [Fistulina hepatica ATCC 64428]
MLHSPTGRGWTQVSPIESLVTRACDPSLPEPNYALHLEVADYINQKKANNPREAAMLVARLANHRNPHIAILALALLDTLTQSCGYPFHLQISTKEFLNELVRRFPERPPPFPGPVMSRILDLIQGWKEGICADSRWREDLGNIRDMHRLLTFKGYRFREVTRPPPSIAATSNLKSAEELENEDREAQSAKLQELIRRGTPRDLAAAQEIMKSLAGANPDAKPDYRAQALTELNKLEQKVILMNEMLDNVDVEGNERFTGGDVYEQVAEILQSARPKIQKWINDAETDDSESLDTFLQINDQINTVLGRYEAYKKGDLSAAKNPVPAEVTASSSLIDFDDSTPAASTGANAIDDLASLFGGSAPSNPSVTPAVATAAQPFISNATPPANNGGYGMSLLMTSGVAPQTAATSQALNALRAMSSSPPDRSMTPPAAIMLPSTPVNNQPHSQNSFPPPNIQQTQSYSGTPPLLPSQPMHTAQPAQQPVASGQMGVSTSPQPAAAPASTTSAKDPFADLAGLF